MLQLGAIYGTYSYEHKCVSNWNGRFYPRRLVKVNVCFLLFLPCLPPERPRLVAPRWTDFFAFICCRLRLFSNFNASFIFAFRNFAFFLSSSSFFFFSLASRLSRFAFCIRCLSASSFALAEFCSLSFCWALDIFSAFSTAFLSAEIHYKFDRAHRLCCLHPLSQAWRMPCRICQSSLMFFVR